MISFVVLTVVRSIYLINESFLMDQIKTSKNKNHFYLKKSQKAVGVVLALFLFYQYLISKKSKRKQINKLVPYGGGCSKISSKDREIVDWHMGHTGQGPH